jgi:WD40 repeat protein
MPSATATPVLLSPTPHPSATFTPPPTPTGLPLLRYPPNDLVLALAWSPDGKLLAVAAGQSVHLIDAGTLAEQRSLPVGAWAGSLAFRPDGSLLALAAKDGTLQVWRLADGQQLCKLEAHHPGAKSVDFSPDGRWLASTGNDAYVRLWDMSVLTSSGECDQTPSAELIGGTFSVPFAVFNPDGSVIASIDYQTILLREVPSQRLAGTLSLDASMFSLAYSPDGSLLASGDLGNTVRVWDAASGELLHTLVRPGLPNEFIWSVAFSPDGKLLAAGSSDATVSLWDAVTGKLVREFNGHTQAVTGVAFSPDGLRLASGSLDASVRIWQLGFP